ncbi:MAG: AraC family transcriptional regulator [Polyangiaceae bacterium]|nr:AraC family transcriptional regulator [Polyangiaceae bacterium]MCW5792623.1 AraC family transcriptional regulator [Polyangiaceae bacterium]
MQGLPGAYAGQLLEVAARFGAPRAELTRGLALGELESPSTWVDLPTLAELVRRATELSGEPALCFHMGIQMRLSWHGFLGFAAMAAGTVGEALGLASQFIRTRASAIELTIHAEGDTASLALTERAPLGELREFITIALFVGLARMGRDLTGHELRGAAELAFEEPSYYQRLSHLLPGVARFGRRRSRLVFPAEVLALPLVTSDASAMRLAVLQCERELQRLAAGESALAARVRAAIRAPESGFAKLPEVARVLGLAPRTLKRRLAEQGLSYSALLEELASARAELLLADPALSIAEVAARVGYTDVTNFSRAFKRWSGVSPAAYRKAK